MRNFLLQLLGSASAFLGNLYLQKTVILIAAIISYSIEFSQLLTKRGLFELFDDPFHNVLGAIIGFRLWRMIMKRCSEKSEGQAIRQK